MTAQAHVLDEFGTFDYVVVEFPGSHFNGELNPALLALVHQGLIRIVDLVFIHKAADGTIDSVEVADADPAEAGVLAGLECDVPGLMSDADIAEVAEALEPGSSAALLVWENVWAAPFAAAVRRAGGQMVASGRIPLADLLETIATEPDDES